MAIYPLQKVLEFQEKLKTVLGLVPKPPLEVSTLLQPVLIANPPEIPANVTVNLPDVLNIKLTNFPVGTLKAGFAIYTQEAFPNDNPSDEHWKIGPDTVISRIVTGKLWRICNQDRLQ